ncbi:MULTISPECIES: multicopper oxidase family protein [unclassified Paenibacillus]|nr:MULTISPECIES: multicopper oxidase family protein [unclassified Paenibacillus]EPY12308.1 multicopper oxidase type 3 [Paenibacillus alvei A6-6i-x]
MELKSLFSTRNRMLQTMVVTGIIALLASGCWNGGTAKDHTNMDHASMSNKQDSKLTSNTDTDTVKEIVKRTVTTPTVDGTSLTITAQPSNLEVSNGVVLPVWTFNNSVPGPQIRVKVGDTVKIKLENELPEPVSIHWHGYPVPNGMDGIPGVTQDAVVPGKSFIYEFKATVPGTYWYHSHQDSVNQVDKGLYGSLIVEDPKEQVDRDYTLVLDEWISTGKMDTERADENQSNNQSDMSGMDHSKMNMSKSGMSGMDHGTMSMGGHDMSMYDLFTMNGKSGDAIEPLMVKQGEKVRIRLINAGYLSHQMHLQGHEFKVIAMDGQSVNSPAVIQDQVISIAPGERYDLEFVADNPGTWLLDEHSKEERARNMRAVIHYEDFTQQAAKSDAWETLPQFNLAAYGKMAETAFTLDQTYDQQVMMNLNTEMRNGEMVYTINGKVFPDTDKIKVAKGDKVMVTFVNQSPTDDHPMHLHGHFFQVLSRNGQPLQGSPVVKDTLNVKPGEQYVIAFEADNPGDWMFHCHDLHHASAGMVTDVTYKDYKSTYVPDPNVPNKPE